MTLAFSKQAGKGLSDGVTSEVATYFDVIPGHHEKLRAAVGRFTEAVRNLDPKSGIRTGLRDTRHVIFDDGLRLSWCMTFEGEWDACVDNALLVIGVEHFLDWLRHTVQGEEFVAWAASVGGVEKLDKNDPGAEKTMKESSARLMAVLQAVQTQAVAYFNPLGALTLLQIIRAQRLEEAFRRVLGTPVAAEALRHPALKPLLRQAGAALGLRDSRANALWRATCPGCSERSLTVWSSWMRRAGSCRPTPRPCLCSAAENSSFMALRSRPFSPVSRCLSPAGARVGEIRPTAALWVPAAIRAGSEQRSLSCP